jgi:sporulation protein YlmC with PRC-barrel domain
LAATAIDSLPIGTADADDQASRMRRLLKGPEEFRELRVDMRSVVNGNIFNSSGIRVGVVIDNEVFGLRGQKLYDLKGSSIYKLNGDLVGHLSDPGGAKKRLDKATDKLFPST